MHCVHEHRGCRGIGCPCVTLRRCVCAWRGVQGLEFSVEYVSAELPDAQELSGIGADFEEFKRIFERFTPAERLTNEQPEVSVQ